MMARPTNPPGPGPRLARRLAPLAFLLLAPHACGDDDDSGGTAGGGGATFCAPAQVAPCACADGAPGVQTCAADGAAFGECACAPPGDGCGTPVEEARPIEGQTHVETCTARLPYQSNPPSSGQHYPQWAAFGVYRDPVPPEFFVHNLEHGAIVIAHNCPGACPPGDAACPGRCAAAIAEAEALAATYAPDPRCAPPVRNRLLVTPLPTLDVPFAAAAWGHTLRASCFDRAAFLRFADAHYAAGPENICADGVSLFEGGPPCPRLPP
ncbi:MAG TPA: DUF3105 domain-containing protein [Polyangiaceae bacterium]|nr:DUF3105 domain-containing protein [Polyangiaceae bacterium]